MWKSFEWTRKKGNFSHTQKFVKSQSLMCFKQLGLSVEFNFWGIFEKISLRINFHPLRLGKFSSLNWYFSEISLKNMICLFRNLFEFRKVVVIQLQNRCQFPTICQQIIQVRHHSLYYYNFCLKLPDQFFV